MATGIMKGLESILESIPSSRIKNAALKAQLISSVRLLEESWRVLATTPPQTPLIGGTKVVEMRRQKPAA
jgi:hypothetical protein